MDTQRNKREDNEKDRTEISEYALFCRFFSRTMLPATAVQSLVYQNKTTIRRVIKNIKAIRWISKLPCR